MGKQCKNTLNTTKNNMAPTEISGSKTARLEHSSTDEAGENELKSNFMRMFEVFKEEMYSL